MKPIPVTLALLFTFHVFPPAMFINSTDGLICALPAIMGVSVMLQAICTGVSNIPPDHCAIYLSSDNITAMGSTAPTNGGNCAGCWGTDCRCVPVNNIPACFPSSAVVSALTTL